MNIPPTASLVALIVDMFAMSLVLGATTWFFFIQSPVLFKSMERERFVPLQMRLAVVLFNTATVALAVMVVGAALRAGSLLAWPPITGAFALAAACINKFIVLPRALKAGGQSRRKLEAQGEAGTTVDFALEGAGPTAKVMHRTVVVFVVLMVAGLVAHGLTLVTV